MNWDRVEGNWKEFKGKVQQKWGKLTNDDLDVVEGKRKELSRPPAAALRLCQGSGRERNRYLAEGRRLAPDVTIGWRPIGRHRHVWPHRF